MVNKQAKSKLTSQFDTIFLMGEVKEGTRYSERKEYYTQKISEYLSNYPQNFEDFVGDPEIIKFGDELLSHRLSTGYNFATFEQFPINSKKSLIFYSIYCQRREHFGKLLARMEQEGIIEESDVIFGVMGTKILGRYKDKEPVVRMIEMQDGSIEQTLESVETSIIFRIKKGLDREQQIRYAERIGAFLLARAPRIKGGYKDPNTRATNTSELVEALVIRSGNRFQIALANVYVLPAGNVIALKQESPIESDTKPELYKNLVNEKLYKYLRGFGVDS